MLKRICVAGAGSWGTVVAALLARNGHEVSLVCREPEVAEGIRRLGENPKYARGLRLPDAVHVTCDLASALSISSSAYLAIPSRYLRAAVLDDITAWRNWAAYSGTHAMICNLSKGLLSGPVQRTDEWLAEALPGVSIVHLSGPNLAAEIAQGLPAAAVAAAAPGQRGQEAAARVQAHLNNAQYRVYTGQDPVGVETAGFYKNIIAIAAGLAQGLAIGSNAHAVLITRGLAEMGRLVQHLGGQPTTLLGLAGVGDLIATCGSSLSRNFQTGTKLAMGMTLDEIQASSVEVAEGVQASRALHEWPAELATQNSPLGRNWPELPIATQVYRVTHEGLDPKSALDELMSRPPRQE